MFTFHTNLLTRYICADILLSFFSIITIGLDPVNDITDPDVNVDAEAFINVLPSSYKKV